MIKEGVQKTLIVGTNQRIEGVGQKEQKQTGREGERRSKNGKNKKACFLNGLINKVLK